MGKIKITCEDAATICTKAQYNEASFFEKLKLQLHLAYCKTCRLFSKQNSQMSNICNLAKKQEEIKSEQSLSEEFKRELEKKMKEGLENNN